MAIRISYQSWSKERQKEYYELQLQAVNIEALWNFKGADPEEQFAWRERKRQEHEKILLKLKYGDDGWWARALRKYKDGASESTPKSDTWSDLIRRLVI